MFLKNVSCEVFENVMKSETVSVMFVVMLTVTGEAEQNRRRSLHKGVR